MPRISPRPFGGNALSGGMYGDPPDPLDWQHQPGDHSDTGILPLLTPVSGVGGVSFGFSLSGTAEITYSASGGVAFGFSVSGSGTVSPAAELTFCSYDYPGDTYDNADDTYDCSGEPEPPAATGGYGEDDDTPAAWEVDDEEVLAVLVAALQHIYR